MIASLNGKVACLNIISSWSHSAPPFGGLHLLDSFFFFKYENFFLFYFIYFIYGCVGSSFLCEGFL